MADTASEGTAEDGWQWEEADVINCSMLENRVERGKLIIPENVLEVLQWDVFMQEVHDDNGPGHVECPLCGARVGMQWRAGKRVDQPSDIQHKPNCPWAWAQEVLVKRTGCREVQWREGEYRFKLWAHPHGISWKASLLTPSGRYSIKTFRSEAAAETWVHREVGTIRSVEHEQGAVTKAAILRSKIFIGRKLRQDQPDSN